MRLLAALVNGGIRVRGGTRYLREVIGARRVYATLLQELLRRPGAAVR